MLLPGRHANTSDYRYGFNGKEMDNEIKGEGLQIDYGFRIYDPRIGKFLSMDPLFRGFPYYTPYQFAGNRPIWAIDLDGLEEYTKTSSRNYSIDYIINSTGETIEGSFNFYSRSEKKTMKINSGIKRLSSKGEEGGAVFITKKWYRSAGVAATKNGLKQYDLVAKEYFGTGEFVPSNPSDPSREVYNTDGENVKPIISTVTEVEISKNVTNNVVAEPEPTNKVKQPKDIFKTVTKVDKLHLSVNFESLRAKFSNDKQAERILTPILEKLKSNSNNFVVLSPNTSRPKGYDLSDWFGLFADGDTSDELVENRGKMIKKWFTDRGVNEKQVKIDTKNSFNKRINVTGVLVTQEKTKVKQ